MADTLQVDIFSMVQIPKIVPIVNLPHPVYNITLTEDEILMLIQMPNYNLYKAGTNKRVDGDTFYEYFPRGGGGGGGSSDYNDLINKPSINNVTLRDNVSLSQLGALQLPSTGKVGQPILIKTVTNNKPSDVECKDYDPPYENVDIDAIIKE